jgi:hypothetical protein
MDSTGLEQSRTSVTTREETENNRKDTNDMATVKIEGQEYQIDDAIANGGATAQESDQLLRDALRPNFEIAAGATFQREVRNGQLYITLVKQPGPKGASRLLSVLLEAPAYINPIMALSCEMHLLEARGALDLPALLAVQPRIDDALGRGAGEERHIAAALRVLSAAPAVASSDVPSGL